MKKISFNQFIIGVLILLFCIVGVVLLGERISIWVHGMSKLANDVEDYYHAGFPIEGEYTVEIDLKDLDSNEGNLLFKEDQSRIYVEAVICEEGFRCEIYFRSTGPVNVDGARLVSGLEHARTDGGFTTLVHAEAVATYGEKTYDLNSASQSGLNYRDGDMFSFYLFPEIANLDVNLDKESTVTVTVSNLYMNIWAKKIR